MQCPACAGVDVQSIEDWPVRDRQVVACWECGLLFLHPQPDPATLEAYYAAGGGWQSGRPDPPDDRAQRKTKRAASIMFAVLDRFLDATRPQPGARVLDYGCGTGSWLNSFQDHGWETFGIEPSSSVAFVRHHRLLAVPEEPLFDLVILYHVLEHLPRPLDTLRALAQAVRPGGFCLVSVPRLDMVHVYGDRNYCLNPRKHIVAFTEACLRGLLARGGFSTVTALHDLDDAFSKGQPLKLRLLAQRAPVAPPLPDPAAALHAVIGHLAPLSRAR